MNITPYLWIPIVTWAVTQGIKFSLALIKGDVNLRYLFASGGMPSVHSAVVCSLATVAFIDGGVLSPLFGITGIFAAIVMYDSFGVRRSSGEQAKTINKLIDDLSASGKVRNIENYEHLREILGHKPLEVTIGAILGVVLAGLFQYQKISPQLMILLKTPSLLMIKVLAVIGIVVAVGGYIVGIYIKKSNRSKRYKSFGNKVLLSNLVFGLIIFLVAFGGYQNISLLDNYLSIIVVLVLGISWDIYLFTIAKAQLNQDLKGSNPRPIRTRNWLKRAKKI